MEQHDNFINGDWRAPEGGRRYPIHNPASPCQALGEFADSGPEDLDAAVCCRLRCGRGLGKHARTATRRAALPLRSIARGKQSRARPHRYARNGQSARRGDGRGRPCRRRGALLWGRGQPPGGAHLPERAGRFLLLHGTRTPGRSGRYFPMEFPGSHARSEDRSRARMWKHGRVQARVADAVVGRPPDEAVRGGGDSSRGRQPRHGPRWRDRRPACG